MQVRASMAMYRKINSDSAHLYTKWCKPQQIAFVWSPQKDRSLGCRFLRLSNRNLKTLFEQIEPCSKKLLGALLALLLVAGSY